MAHLAVAMVAMGHPWPQWDTPWPLWTTHWHLMEPIHTRYNSPPTASGAIPGPSLVRITIVYHSYSTHQTPWPVMGLPWPLMPPPPPLTLHKSYSTYPGLPNNSHGWNPTSWKVHKTLLRTPDVWLGALKPLKEGLYGPCHLPPIWSLHPFHSTFRKSSWGHSDRFWPNLKQNQVLFAHCPELCW